MARQNLESLAEKFRHILRVTKILSAFVSLSTKNRDSVKLTLEQAVKISLLQFFAQKLYSDGMTVLPGKWQNTINPNDSRLI